MRKNLFVELAYEPAKGRTSVMGTEHYRLGSRLGSTASDGIFAEWDWDGQKLLACNDRYGIAPLFYSLKGNTVLLSSSTMLLLERGADAEPDWVALAVFFRLGWFLGNDTPWKAVKVLPPGGRLEWERGELTISGGHAPSPRATLTRSRALDEYIGRFRASIAHRPPPEGAWAVPLSGGRDSRHILAELVRQKRRPTYVPTIRRCRERPLDDGDCAGRVADCLGVPHTLLLPRGSSGRCETLKNQVTHFCTDEHYWLVSVARWLQEHQVRCIYDGIAGDVLSAGLFLCPEWIEYYRRSALRSLASAILDRWAPGDHTVVPFLSAKQARACDLAVANQRLVEELARHADAANPVTSFFFWNRTRRGVGLAPFGVLNEVPTIYCPYLDHEVFDLLDTLPAEYVLDHAFHDEAILRAYPHLAHVPFSSGEVAPPRGDKLSSCAYLLSFTLRENPRRIPALLNWATLLALGRRKRVRWRQVHYLIQFEAMQSRVAAHRRFCLPFSPIPR